MRSKQKIIVGVIVLLVLVNLAVFSFFIFGGKKGDGLETQIVKENDQKEKTLLKDINSDLIQAKITKIDDGNVEYEAWMLGTQEIEEEKRQAKIAKIGEDANLYVSCEELSLREWLKDEAEKNENDVEETQSAVMEGEEGGSMSAREPDEFCQAQLGDFSVGDSVSMKAEEGSIFFMEAK